MRNAHVYPLVSNEYVLPKDVSIFTCPCVCKDVAHVWVGMCVRPRGRLRTPRTKWSPLILSSAVSQSVFFFYYFILFLRFSSPRSRYYICTCMSMHIFSYFIKSFYFIHAKIAIARAEEKDDWIG